MHLLSTLIVILLSLYVESKKYGRYIFQIGDKSQRKVIS